MSLITAEGLDDMDSGEADLRRYFTDSSVGGSDACTVQHDIGRYGAGSNGISLGGSVGGFCEKNFDPTGTLNPFTIITGVAFFQSVSTTRTIINFANALGETIGSVWVNSLEEIEVRDANNTIIFTTPGSPVTLGAWHFLEAKLTTGDPGNMEVRLDQGPDDNTALFNGAGDFQDTPATPIRIIRWNGNNSASRIDDLHILNTDGPYNNDFLGDGRIIHLRPDADTGPNEMVPSTGIEHFAVVNEDPADGTNPELEFLTTSVGGDTENFSLDDLPISTDRVQFAVVNAKALKDSGSRDMILRAISGLSSSQENFNLLTSYLFYQHGMDVNPATNQPWTRAAIDNLIAGLESS